MSINTMFQHLPEIKITKCCSGCPETDALCPPVRLSVVGKLSEHAEKIADCAEVLLFQAGWEYQRQGPRQIFAWRDIECTHFSDETVSF